MEIQRRWIWQTAIILGIVAFIAILIFRANPPKERTERERPTVAFTSGSFVSGPLTVEAGSYLHFKFVLNGQKTLVGKFTSAGFKGKIECLILDEKNFELFNNGSDFQKIVATGLIPGGKVNRSLAAGTFYLILDNRSGKEKVDLAEADFSVE